MLTSYVIMELPVEVKPVTLTVQNDVMTWDVRNLSLVLEMQDDLATFAYCLAVSLKENQIQ